MTFSTPPTPPGSLQVSPAQANPKGDLIARLITLGAGAPTFQVTSDGPAHERTFRVRVLVGGRELGEGGEGRSKKDAERLASEAALRVLDGQKGAEPLAETEQPDEEPQGQWPIYAAVLAGALDAALDLAPEDATVDEVRREAGRLYRDLLADLGHGPE